MDLLYHIGNRTIINVIINVIQDIYIYLKINNDGYMN